MKEEFKQTQVGQKLVAAKNTATRARNTLEVGAHRKKEALKDRIKATDIYQKAKEAKGAVKNKIKNTEIFKKFESTEGYKLLKSLPGLLSKINDGLELEVLSLCKEAYGALKTIIKKKAEFISLIDGDQDKKKMKKAISVGEELLKQQGIYKESILKINSYYKDSFGQGLASYRGSPEYCNNIRILFDNLIIVVSARRDYINGDEKITDDEYELIEDSFAKFKKSGLDSGVSLAEYGVSYGVKLG